jgi:hypothetical protein
MAKKRTPRVRGTKTVLATKKKTRQARDTKAASLQEMT